MGNSPPSGGLRPANGDKPSNADVGRNFNLVFTGKKVVESTTDGTTTESWQMVYNARMASYCVFILSKKTLNHSALLSPPRTPTMLEINIYDDSTTAHRSKNCFSIKLQRDEASGLLHVTNRPWICHDKVFNFVTTTNNAYGGITETFYDIYGSGRRWGLLIREWKRNEKNELPYTRKVMHYYVNGENGVDVGFYVAIKRIRLSRDGSDFDFGMDGPEQHPAHALAYMIEEALRTKTWKPTYCPHCANKYIDERQSETESDTDIPAPIAGTIVSNPGKFKGKDIANTYIKNFNYARTKR